MKQHTDGLPRPLESLAVWMLNRVGKIWTERFYNAVNRITALTAVYPVVLRQRNGKVQVLLTTRNDLIYQGMVHHPGSMVRWSDQPGNWREARGFDAAVERVREKELGGVSFNTFAFAGSLFHQTPRGAEIAVVFACELASGKNPSAGEWYDVSSLPANLIEHEFAVNLTAVRKFRELIA